jgi:hypothetical protein
MENCQSDNSSNELEVVQMFGIDAGVRVDLKGVIIMCRVFKETIEGVEHFVREKEEVFTRAELAYDILQYCCKHTEKVRHNLNHPRHRI